MESGKKRIRLEFAPLNVAASTVCVTPNSPVTQVYNSLLNEYEPDRTLTPAIILPSVVANATDGSWAQPYSNQYLADVKWYANGVDISTITDWQGKYEIEATGSQKGKLTIKKNILPEERVSMVFKAKLVDSRTGLNYPIETDPVVLTTVTKSKADYSVSIGDTQTILYDVFKDKLAEYEYKVAHGLISSSATAKAEAEADVNSYLRDIPVTVYMGGTPVSEGFSVKYYRVNSNLTLTLLNNTDDDEVIDADNTHITLDLRLVTKKDYVARVIVDSRTVAQIQFSVNRVYRKYTVRTTNGTAISASDTERADEAMVDCDGNIVECPEVMLKMVWKTDTAALTGKTHNEGQKTLFQLSSTGIGNDYTNDWLDTYIESEQKEAYCVAAETQTINGQSTEVVWTDGGEDLIFN